MTKEAKIQVLKIYRYKGAQIFLRQIQDDIFEFLIVYKNRLFSDFFYLDEAERKKLNKKEQGGAAFLVANAAEGVVDAVVKKYSLRWRFFWKYFTPHIEKNATNRHNNSQ